MTITFSFLFPYNLQYSKIENYIWTIIRLVIKRRDFSSENWLFDIWGGIFDCCLEFFGVHLEIFVKRDIQTVKLFHFYHIA